MTSALPQVLSGLDDARGWQEELYRDLHAHPELSHREHRTARLVAERLTSLGYDVRDGVGGTGVVGILRNGDGPTVLLRADMDALPIRERTGLAYASTDTADDDGQEVPVTHACGHDVHVVCLLGAAALLAGSTAAWGGAVVALFQPAEEVGTGAQGMLDDDLAALVGTPDVALAQHVLPYPVGTVGTRPGSFLSAADTLRITLHGRGAHGSMPQAAVDPVVLASMVVLRLQTIVSRELSPTTPAVLTIGSLHAGSAGNVISDEAVLQLNVRTYDEATRTQVLDAVTRIVRAECAASGSPQEPTVEVVDHYPPTVNDADTTARVRAAFDTAFGDAVFDIDLQTASEDFSVVPDALGTPYCYWGNGGIDPDAYAVAQEAGRIASDVPVNHSPTFSPVVQPTLDTGTSAMVTAALAWLAPDGDRPA
nr:amidohydrolase [Terracoccus luteus]